MIEFFRVIAITPSKELISFEIEYVETPTFVLTLEEMDMNTLFKDPLLRMYYESEGSKEFFGGKSMEPLW